MSPIQPRQIVEEKTFTDAFALLKIDYQRLDEVLLGVTMALCVHPEKCDVIPGTILSIIKTRPFPAPGGKGVPALRIFFTYTEQQVHLRYVELV